MALKAVANYILPDEPCWGLYEGPMLIPRPDGSVQNRWGQDLIVIRSDRKAHFVTDFGPAEDYEDVTPLMMPSEGENTIAQLQWHAEKNRQDNYWQERAAEMASESTLIADIVRQVEQIHERIHNRSTFGPLVRVERSGYSRTQTTRKFRAQREAYYGRRQV